MIGTGFCPSACTAHRARARLRLTRRSGNFAVGQRFARTNAPRDVINAAIEVRSSPRSTISQRSRASPFSRRRYHRWHAALSGGTASRASGNAAQCDYEPHRHRAQETAHRQYRARSRQMPQQPIAVNKANAEILMTNNRTRQESVTMYTRKRTRHRTTSDMTQIICHHDHRSAGLCVVLIGLHGDTQRLGDRPRPATADKRDTHISLDQKSSTAQDALPQHRRRALHFLRHGQRHKEHRPYAPASETRYSSSAQQRQNPAASFLFRRLEQRTMIGTIRRRFELHGRARRPQIAGVIDDAGEIGILIIHAHHLQHDGRHGFHHRGKMPSPRSPISTALRPAIDCSQCWPSTARCRALQD